MPATQEEINELVADTAAELAHEFSERMPGHRFVNVDSDGTPENALIMVQPGELVELLKVTLEAGMEIEREGTT